MPLMLAVSFLVSSLLTILLPLGLIVAITVWYVLGIKRVPRDTPADSPSLPPPEVVEAAGPAVVADVTPVDPPSDES